MCKLSFKTSPCTAYSDKWLGVELSQRPKYWQCAVLSMRTVEPSDPISHPN